LEIEKHPIIKKKKFSSRSATDRYINLYLYETRAYDQSDSLSPLVFILYVRIFYFICITIIQNIKVCLIDLIKNHILESTVINS